LDKPPTLAATLNRSFDPGLLATRQLDPVTSPVRTALETKPIRPLLPLDR
jgi:hypothetical protein